MVVVWECAGVDPRLPLSPPSPLPPSYRYAHGEKRGSSLTHPAHAGELRDGVAQRQQVQHWAETFPSEITVQSRHDDLLSVVIRRSFAPLHEIRDELRLDVGIILKDTVT